MSYDRALTVFSPDGHLFQVEYAMEAVKRGAIVVGLRGKEVVVIGAEMRQTQELQDPRTIKKILKVDDHITMAFAGLTADARVLVNKARLQCQSHRLTVEDAPSVAWVAGMIAEVQQKATSRGGRRPFGIATLLAGHDMDGTPQLWQTDPSGNFSEWKAACTGRNAKSVREMLEEEYQPDLDEEEAVRTVCRVLLESAERGAEGIQITIMRHGEGMSSMTKEQVLSLCQEIEKEDSEDAAEEAKA